MERAKRGALVPPVRPSTDGDAALPRAAARTEGASVARALAADVNRSNSSVSTSARRSTTTAE
jgi:hypothetical protein